MTNPTESLNKLLEKNTKFITDLENFLGVIGYLKGKLVLPEHLPLLLFFNEIIFCYQQLLPILKKFDQLKLSHKLAKKPTDNFVPPTEQADLFNTDESNIILAALKAAADNYPYFLSQLKPLAAILGSVENLAKNDRPTAITDDNIITYLQKNLSAPSQQLSLCYEFLSHIPLKDVTNQAQTIGNSIPPKEIAEPAAHPLKLTLGHYRLMARRLPSLIFASSANTLASSKQPAKSPLLAEVQKIQQNNKSDEQEGAQIIAEAFYLLSNWQNSQSWWQQRQLKPIIKQLRNQLYETYFRLKICGKQSVIDVISANLKSIAAVSPEHTLIGLLTPLIKDFYSTFQVQEEPQAYICRPILGEVLLILDNFKRYYLGKSFINKPTQLEVEVFYKIYRKLEILKNQLNIHQVTHENFWLELINIFQRHTHIAGEFPSYFYQSKLGDMLRQVASKLDHYKPAAYRSAFELITAPDSYPYTTIHVKKSEHILSILPEHITPARLCLNIQRIRDFYCNTGLGKLIAQETQGYSLNLKQKWREHIIKLDETITRLYLEQLHQPERSLATLNKMLQAINNTADSIYQQWAGTNSRLANSLYTLHDLFSGKEVSSFNYQAKPHLPAGIISSTAEFNSDDMVENYVQKHIAQSACSPFIQYYNTVGQRFFRSTSFLKLKHTKETSKQLNKFYNQIPPINCAGESKTNHQSNFFHNVQTQVTQVIKQQFETEAVLLEGSHGKATQQSHNYFKKLGFTL